MPLSIPVNVNKTVLSQFSLSGKTAFVTGGSRGIGLEVVRGLAEAGADVALSYSTTSAAEADATASSIGTATGVSVKAYQVDVRDPDAIAKTLAEVTEDFGGKLDIVVANAGIATHYAALEYTPEQFQDIVNVNLNGAFYTAQAAGKIFKEQGTGNLIFTASVSAILVNVPQKQAAYNTSKAGVVQLARCLAVEWVDFARVNCVSPGFIATDMLAVHPQEWKDKWFSMIPAARLCNPAELKGSYVYLASDASSYMTGANLVVDGAYTLP